MFAKLPNGLASASRIFSEIMKPVHASLRCKGLILFGYIDDSYVQVDNFDSCKTNIFDTTTIFESFGSAPHPSKTVITPVQKSWGFY